MKFLKRLMRKWRKPCSHEVFTTVTEEVANHWKRTTKCENCDAEVFVTYESKAGPRFIMLRKADVADSR